MNIQKIAVVLIAAASLIACGGAEDRKAAYMEKAKNSLKSGDLDKARIELKNVLQIDPKDAPGYFMLGEVHEKQKEFKKAFGYINKALELEPDNLKYQAKLARYYLILAGDTEKAKEMQLAIEQKDKDNIDGRILKAGILLREEEKEKAENILREIFTAHPDNKDAAVTLSTILSSKKMYDEAISVLTTVNEKHPSDAALLSTLGNVLFISKNYDRAEETFKKVIDLKPDVFNSYVILAKFYRSTEKADEAEKVLRDAIEADDEDTSRKLVLIDFIRQLQGNSAAITELETMVAEHSDAGELHLLLADLYALEKDTDKQIEKHLDTVERFPEGEFGIKARLALVKIYAAKGDKDASIKMLDQALEIAPNDADVNLLSAKRFISEKDFESAIIALRTVTKDQPDNIEAYLLLAASHNAQGEKEQAGDVLESAHENNRGNLKGLLSLAKYYVGAKNLESSEKIIDDYLALDPNGYDAVSLKAELVKNQKKFDEAKEFADRLLEHHPERENGYILSAEHEIRNENIKRAKEILTTGYDKAKTVKLVKLLGALMIDTGKVTEALSKLKAHPDNEADESVQLLIAQAYFNQKETDLAVKTLKDSLAYDETRETTYITLARVYGSSGKSDEAIAVLENGVDKNQRNAKLRFSLAEVYQRSNNIEAAIAQYEELYRLNPNNLLVVNNLASLLSDYRTDADSLNRAMELAEKLAKVKEPAIQDTVAWVHYKNSKYADAVKIYEKIVELKPDVDLFNYRMGMSCHKAGDNTCAKERLGMVVNSKNKFPYKSEAEKIYKTL